MNALTDTRARRTFAVTSCPDAGQSTITEVLTRWDGTRLALFPDAWRASTVSRVMPMVLPEHLPASG